MLPPHPTQKLIDVLKVSTQWEVDTGRQWALYYLDQASDVPAPLRLQIARRYDVPKWIEPALRELVFHTPLSALRREDLSHLGFPAYVLVTKLKEAMENERRTIAHHAPTISTHDVSCNDNTRCAVMWREVWWMKIGRRLLDPSPRTALQLTDLPEAVRGLDCSGISVACREGILEQVSSSSGLKGVEHIFVMGMSKLADLPLE